MGAWIDVMIKPIKPSLCKLKKSLRPGQEGALIYKMSSVDYVAYVIHMQADQFAEGLGKTIEEARQMANYKKLNAMLGIDVEGWSIPKMSGAHGEVIRTETRPERLRC
jgi:SUMO ligase MMS21 Smc5/6 complex component